MRPAFGPDNAARLVVERVGLTVTARELPSGEDRAFELSTTGGEGMLLKVSGRSSRAALECEIEALLHLRRAQLSVAPTPIAAKNGDLLLEVEDGRGHPVVARLLTWIDGYPLRDLSPLTPHLLDDVGRQIGRLDRALAAFDHLGARREHEWDLARAHTLRPMVAAVENPTRRRLVTAVFDRLDRELVPLLGELPRSIIHGDINDDNLLFDQPYPTTAQVAGFIDFSDIVHSVTVAEVAIACAYAMLGRPDPHDVCRRLVEAYDRERPLDTTERDLVPLLAAARLCTTVLMSARARRRGLTNPHLFVSERAAWRLLEIIV